MKENQQSASRINLYIRRDNIFMNSYEQLRTVTIDDLKERKLHIQLEGERGQDEGVLTTRDFYLQLTREMFESKHDLFISSNNGSTYYPNPKSYGDEHLKQFQFVGRIMGKALIDECVVECNFARSLYKIMTGEDLNIFDSEDFDNKLFECQKWCL